jgi:hypothetical protein
LTKAARVPGRCGCQGGGGVVHSGDSKAVGGVADPTSCAGLRVAEGADPKRVKRKARRLEMRNGDGLRGREKRKGEMWVSPCVARGKKKRGD